MTKERIEDLARVDIEKIGQNFYLICIQHRQRLGINEYPKENDCSYADCRHTCPLAPDNER